MTPDDQTARDAAARQTYQGCLAAVGVVVVPVLALAELATFLDATRAVGPDGAHGVRRFVVAVLCVVVPAALLGGWRRGRRPLNSPRRTPGRRGYWFVALAGAAVTRFLSPNTEVWLDATLFLLLTVMSAVFAGALVSRVAHGALRGAGPPDDATSG